MSFLQQLQEKRKALQTTTTTVTTATGDRYIESKDYTKTPQMKLQKQKYGFVVDTKPDTKLACILEDFLYLGSQDAVSTENIRKFKLTHILSVGVEAPNIDAEVQLQTLFIPCLDIPESPLFGGIVEKALSFIEAARHTGRVLVHCNAGVSRSASVIIAYLMQQHGLDFECAYGLVKSKRECIQPNAGFLRQLKNYKSRAAELT